MCEYINVKKNKTAYRNCVTGLNMRSTFDMINSW